MPSSHFVVTCDTEFVLCRTALMDCFKHAIFFYLRERLSQNSSPRQSHSAIRRNTDPVSRTASVGLFRVPLTLIFKTRLRKCSVRM